MGHAAPRSRRPRPWARGLSTLVATACFAGCSAAPLPGPDVHAAAAVDVRLLVKLAYPSDDADAIAADASRRAGVPVRYAASTGASWHALLLHCASAGQCDAAIERLRAATDAYAVVERDGRMRPL